MRPQWTCGGSKSQCPQRRRYEAFPAHVAKTASAAAVRYPSLHTIRCSAGSIEPRHAHVSLKAPASSWKSQQKDVRVDVW
eukprot:3860024-Rhodomonas_salina.1